MRRAAAACPLQGHATRRRGGDAGAARRSGRLEEAWRVCGGGAPRGREAEIALPPHPTPRSLAHRPGARAPSPTLGSRAAAASRGCAAPSTVSLALSHVHVPTSAGPRKSSLALRTSTIAAAPSSYAALAHDFDTADQMRLDARATRCAAAGPPPAKPASASRRIVAAAVRRDRARRGGAPPAARGGARRVARAAAAHAMWFDTPPPTPPKPAAAPTPPKPAVAPTPPTAAPPRRPAAPPADGAVRARAAAPPPARRAGAVARGRAPRGGAARVRGGRRAGRARARARAAARAVGRARRRRRRRRRGCAARSSRRGVHDGPCARCGGGRRFGGGARLCGGRSRRAA